MFKLLLWAALIALAVYYWKRKIARPRPVDNARDANHDLPMVRCANCSVHLPENRAFAQGAEWYCCPEHRQLGSKPS